MKTENAPIGQNDLALAQPPEGDVRDSENIQAAQTAETGKEAAVASSALFGLRAARLSPDWFRVRFLADSALSPHSSPLILKFIGEENSKYDLRYRFDIECGENGTKTFRVTKEYLKALHYQIGEYLNGDVCVNPYS